jgi:2-dehydro-3-deoxygluconokinase
VGDDPFRPFLETSWKKEGIDLSAVTPLKDKPNGLYFISLLPGGEREFTYYRAGSAASFLAPEDIDPQYIEKTRILYASGISQAISESSRAAVKKAFAHAHEKGVAVAFDPNLRTRLWTLETARNALEEIIPYIDILLPGAPEEISKLFCQESGEAVIRMMWDRGVRVIAVKQGGDGALLGVDGEIHHILAYRPETIVDTSGAGDAFNGAFLYGLASGMKAVDAARLGVVMAGLKLRGRGAIFSLPHREEVFEVYRKQYGKSPE